MVMAEDLQCLKVIALMGRNAGQVWISSQTLGKTLDISPQTASRRLISLENQQYITRTIRPDGQYVAVTKDGEGILRGEYSDYCKIFGPEETRFHLEGEVIDGLGEGRYYISLPGYHDQFVERLGFDPFPGTFNLRLSAPSIMVRKKLDGLEWIQIDGFSAEGRTFGNARCLPCTIQEIPCAIVMPGRSHYPEDIIEIISPVELRSALHTEGEQNVVVEVAYV